MYITLSMTRLGNSVLTQNAKFNQNQQACKINNIAICKETFHCQFLKLLNTFDSKCNCFLTFFLLIQ